MGNFKDAIATIAGQDDYPPMLHGFEISHFRNFPSEPSVVGPLGKINIFIGANNSGKSNILRYLRDYLAPSLNLSRGNPIQISGVNRSLFTTDDPQFFCIFVPIDEDFLLNTFQLNRPFQKEVMLEFFRTFPGTTDGTHVPISFSTDASQGRRIAYPNSVINSLDRDGLSTIASAMGTGSHPEEVVRLAFERIYQNYKYFFETKYVTAFRQIKTRLSEFGEEYEFQSSGNHIIDDLVKFSNPTYQNQSDKTSFEKLKSFLRDITQHSDLEIEIPHDRSTINVSMQGILRPLEAFGSGLHDLFMLAAEIILNQGKMFLVEEPETHMHPEFQRKFMRFLSDEVDGQFFITTHSPVIIDTPQAKVFGVRSTGGKGSVYALLTDQTKREACREIGYRASDLLQSNCILWVEGPSDRIYLNYWISILAPELREGIEYSIMFYGGRLLSHLSASDELIGDFIKILPINRSVAVIMDSDLGSATQRIRDTKLRLRDEVSMVGGIPWITDGREIENYIPFEVRELAVKNVHKSCQNLAGSRTKYGKPLDFYSINGSLERFPHVLTRRGFPCGRGSDSSFLLDAGGQHGWHGRFHRTFGIGSLLRLTAA